MTIGQCPGLGSSQDFNPHPLTEDDTILADPKQLQRNFNPHPLTEDDRYCNTLAASPRHFNPHPLTEDDVIYWVFTSDDK